MPLYMHVCDHCGKRMEIYREFAEYQDTPNDGDPEYKECTSEEGHKWKKELGNFRLARGNNWSGRKGSW